LLALSAVAARRAHQNGTEAAAAAQDSNFKENLNSSNAKSPCSILGDSESKSEVKKSSRKAEVEFSVPKEESKPNEDAKISSYGFRFALSRPVYSDMILKVRATCRAS